MGISVHHSTGEGPRGTELSLVLPPLSGLGKTSHPSPHEEFLRGGLQVWGLETCVVRVPIQPQAPE